MARPNVFAIPAATPQLPTFAAAFLAGDLFGRGPLSPLEVADATIFVPTRRAGAALAAELARASGARATLLPAILPLGDPDALDEGLAILGLASLAPPVGAWPVIGTLDRRLLLFQLIDRWREAVAGARMSQGETAPFLVGRSRSDAFALAGDLAGLIEEAVIEGLDFSQLAAGLPDDYRPERHSQYWSMTETFLKIAATYYPAALAERRRRDPAVALTAGLAEVARRIDETAPDRPMVVLGSTGSVAATAALMTAIARLPMGAVVLPGLDLSDGAASSWASIGDEASDLPTRYAHPQGMLKRSLQRIGIAREAVVRLPLASTPNHRETLLADIFRPAEATAEWHRSEMTGRALADACAGITLVEAEDEREEALAIALLFRETLETPESTAALVTPNRALARAVQAEMMRWGVVVADSAGEPLAGTPSAALARLVLKAATDDADAVACLSLLRHPLLRLGLDLAARDVAVDAIEIAGLRGKRLAGGTTGGGIAGLPAVMRLAASDDLRRAPQPRKRLADEALAAGLAHAERLALAVSAFRAQTLADAGLRSWARAHRVLVETLLAPDLEAAGALENEDGLALARVFDEVAAAGEDGPQLDLSDYAGIFDQLLAGGVVRPRQPGHSRLKIWGLLEARLLDADRLILGGLDEGVWPPEMRGDPFLNRPMRIAMGLQPPERRIGQTAHDFLMLLGAGNVVLTRARKRGGSPAIASRFLRRLTAFAGAEASAGMAAGGAAVLSFARAIDAPASAPSPVGQPSPRPPGPAPYAGRVPSRLSVTEIETLYRDPYAVYARRILRLDVLPPPDPPLEARERGTIVHEALAQFSHRFAGKLPVAAEDELLAFGRQAFAEIRQQQPEAVEFWLRRFEAFVPWFVGWDRARRMNLRKLHSEVDARHDLRLGDGRLVTLTARADRIEDTVTGGVAVIDYKTGGPPGVAEVLRGLAPQLPLTAALIARGAFPDLGERQLENGVRLGYLQVALAGGLGSERWLEHKDVPAPVLRGVIERQFAELEGYLNKLAAGSLGYTSRRIPRKMRQGGDYDHLARVAEWSLGGAGDSGGDEE